MWMSYKRGQGSIVLRGKILNSSVATGAGLTGLTFESAGLIIAAIADNEATTTAYTQAAGDIEDITTLGVFEVPTAGKCRFREVNPSAHKGIYEVQLADARFAVANAKSMVASISGAANVAEMDGTVTLTDFDPYAIGVLLAGAGLDAVLIETGINARQALAVIGAAVAGDTSGNEDDDVLVKGLGNAITRLRAIIDANSNHTVTLTTPS